MPKTFVIDTNVLLYDASSIFKFGENIVYIPLVVVEELDRFKRDQNENGRNARQFARLVDELRQLGPLGQGVKLENGGTLIINPGPRPEKDHTANLFLEKNTDNTILYVALGLSEKGGKVTVVTKDINLRLKCDAVGVSAEDYGDQDFTSIEELYSGQITLELSAKEIKEFEENRFLSLGEETKGIYPNQYVILHEAHTPSKRYFSRFCGNKNGLVPLIKAREGVWGIYPKNIEQQFAFDALLNNEIKLVSLVGKAGTGKTLLAIAAGLEMTISRHDYARVLVSRPIQPMGKDLGYLPGDIGEKLGPWMQPIFDNIDFLFGNQRVAKESNSWEELINQGLLHVEPLTYIRGRSIPSQFLIVDEAQNLTPHEIKTIITRAGDGTKIVLTGDCEQIDSPYLDSVNNGLAYCVERLKEQEIVSHASLQIGERSLLSEIATKCL